MFSLIASNLDSSSTVNAFKSNNDMSLAQAGGENRAHYQAIVLCDYSMMAGFADMLKQMGQLVFLAHCLNAKYSKMVNGLNRYNLGGEDLLKSIKFDSFIHAISSEGLQLIADANSEECVDVNLDLNTPQPDIKTFDDLLRYCRLAIEQALPPTDNQAKLIKLHVKLQKYGFLNPPFASWSQHFRSLLRMHYVSRSPLFERADSTPWITVHYRLGDTAHFEIGDGLTISSWGNINGSNTPCFTDDPKKSTYPHITPADIQPSIDAALARYDQPIRFSFISDGYDRGIARILGAIDNLTLPNYLPKQELRQNLNATALRSQRDIIRMLQQYSDRVQHFDFLWGESPRTFRGAIQALACSDCIIATSGGFAKWVHLFLNNKPSSVLLSAKALNEMPPHSVVA